MKKYFLFGLVLLLLSLLIGGMANRRITPVYRVSAQAILYRSLIPPAEIVTPEPHNRWVWVRDGLSIKESLLNEGFFLRLLDENQEIKDRFMAFQRSFVLTDVATDNDKGSIPSSFSSSLVQRGNLQRHFFQEIKKQIRIDYGGGDANTFYFQVEDKNPVLAQAIVENLLLELEKAKKRTSSLGFEKQLQVLGQKMDELEKAKSGLGPMERPLVEEKLRQIRTVQSKLYVEGLLRDVENPLTMQVIEPPFIPLHPVWPKRNLIFVLSLLGGLLGFGGVVLFGLKTKS